MKWKSKNSNWSRIIIRWSVIVSMVIVALLSVINKNYSPNFEAFCPFGGIQALGSYLLNNSLACSMTSTQIVMGVLLIVGVILFSKLFCSYICPIGTISEWLGTLGDKLKIRITIKGITDKILRSLKYILLFITLYFTFDSNELFCKEYDPFFAITSGFNVDVTVLYATIAIIVVIMGSVFIRLFWCKYICPLGAISNIFKFTGFFIAIILIYIILLNFGLHIHYAWPLAISCIGGYIIEILGQKSWFFPLAKITRNEETCIECQLCSIKCPQAIDVASVTTVKHIDCNLCGDCVSICPEKGTIQINKRTKLKWLPPVVVIGLFVIGLLLKSVWEIPTIDQKWFSPEEMTNAETYSRSGLKNIKCYGSSMSFASRMKKVEGVYGVATYVRSKKAKVYYNPEVLNESKIEQILFTPLKAPIRSLDKETEEITVVTVLLENFFDNYDFNYLGILLKQKTEAVALQSEYACPVIVKIYFPATTKINEIELITILESEDLSYTMGETQKQVKLEYEVVNDLEYNTITKGEYKTILFNPFESTFNNYVNYDNTVIDVYRLNMGRNRKLRKQLKFLLSHISHDAGIIKLETALDNEFKEVLDISFVDTMTNFNKIHKLLNSDTLSFTYTNGKTGKTVNNFDFGDIGTIIEKNEN